MSAILEKYGLAGLPRDEQLSIADAIYDHADEAAVDLELTPEVKAMLDERIARMDADPTSGVPLEQAIERINRRLQSR
jgi:putative addiction module component (TIGR02574 family)